MQAMFRFTGVGTNKINVNALIFGGAGNDYLWGGKSNDTLYGGSGNDTFICKPGEGTDRIMD